MCVCVCVCVCVCNVRTGSNFFSSVDSQLSQHHSLTLSCLLYHNRISIYAWVRFQTLCSVPLLYLSQSHNLSIIGVLQKVSVPNSMSSSVLFFRIIWLFLVLVPLHLMVYHHSPHSTTFFEAPDLSHCRVCMCCPFSSLLFSV